MKLVSVADDGEPEEREVGGTVPWNMKGGRGTCCWCAVIFGDMATQVVDGEDGGILLDSRLAVGRIYYNRGVSVDRLGHKSGQTGW